MAICPAINFFVGTFHFSRTASRPFTGKYLLARSCSWLEARGGSDLLKVRTAGVAPDNENNVICRQFGDVGPAAYGGQLV